MYDWICKYSVSSFVLTPSILVHDVGSQNWYLLVSPSFFYFYCNVFIHLEHTILPKLSCLSIVVIISKSRQHNSTINHHNLQHNNNSTKHRSASRTWSLLTHERYFAECRPNATSSGEMAALCSRIIPQRSFQYYII